MDPPPSSRLETEISLLESMYPDQLHWTANSRELTYNSSSSSTFTLRLPETYLSTSLPSVLLASTHKSDVRDALQRSINETCQVGEECLDAVIALFDELSSSPTDSEPSSKSTEAAEERGCLTVIIWLHHLLAQSKRKLALQPSSESQHISGLTKPGYPGVMMFSGERLAVKEHVAELKGQKWAAFQVRLEEEGGNGEEWAFEHGRGIKECESMGEVIKGVVGEERREVVCGVLGIK
ncbi:DUF1115-domain-containing protein [Zymoseptoria brevis]|uniref:DUF1115-domain-containing protein n=1 Tax=Zymoseptoria brevis TaxID=1047168 RepID=A0A0F4GVV4_9PEZI|nr:DUF1115-domain-containing protein [Zymoseptoria brevis]